MLKIAICDDEKYFRENVKKYIENYLKNKDIEFEIDVYESGHELISRGIEIVQYSMIFLDINMDEIDGIETAQKIRTFSSDVYIVFVTAYIDYSLEGYKVDAARYILKNNVNFDEAIYECMETLLKKMNYVVRRKEFEFSEGEKTLLLDRILYIESNLHKLIFYVMEQDVVEYTMYSTLNALEKELEGLSFLRVHQSYLVNMKHIKKIDAGSVIMDDNYEISIPRARIKEVKNAFVLYKGEI